MNLMKSLRNAVVVALLFSAGVANAALYRFDLTGDYSASWELDSSVRPDLSEEGVRFVVWDVEGTFPGSFFDITDLTFYNEAIGGGMAIVDFFGNSVLLVTDGSQLYTGSEATPTFRLGSFDLTEYNGTGRYTLRVTDVDPSPVPEPATAAMMLGGLGLLYASRKRRSSK